MSRRFSPLLAGLLATSLIVSAAFIWAGWRLIEEDRGRDTRLTKEQAEATADVFAARIREKLTDLGDRLGTRLATTSSEGAAPPSIPNFGVVVFRSSGLEIDPAVTLPFVPVVSAPREAPPEVAQGEAAEFQTGELDRAAAAYAGLARHPDKFIQAGALIRLGRVLRREGRAKEAVTAYRTLEELGDIATDTTGLPASLLGLEGQRLAHRQLHDGDNEHRTADAIQDGIDRGRWRLLRGDAMFYRDEVSKTPKPQNWQLASALVDAWPTEPGALPARGYVISEETDDPVLVVWRSSGLDIAMAAGPIAAVATAAGTSVHWELADSGGRRLAGSLAHTAGPETTVVTRVIAAGGPVWSLRLWPPQVTAAGGRRAVLIAGLFAMLAFVWAATYLMARAIRREAATARLQTDFVAAVSHEFRSPLSTMRQMTEMLETDRVPAETRRRQYYGVLVSETARLQRLVETLLNFGRLEAGRTPYRPVSVDIARVVDSVVRDIKTEPGYASRTIETRAPAEDTDVRADPEAIMLALRNLVENALKYSPLDSIVRVSWEARADGVAISVHDEGPGIPDEERRAIFGKFVRGRAARDGRVPGTGVGLALAQQIVSAHGGSIDVESEVGRGSTFTMVLPVANQVTQFAAHTVTP